MGPIPVESVDEAILGWLSRRQGRVVGPRNRDFLALRSWLSTHSVGWWDPGDERRAAARMGRKSPVGGERRAALEAALVQVHPESAVAREHVTPVFREVLPLLVESQNDGNPAVLDKSAQDRLRERIEPTLSPQMAQHLGLDERFLTAFRSWTDQTATLTTLANSAADSVAPDVLRLLQPFAEEERRRRFVTGLSDDAILEGLKAAQARISQRPRDWGKHLSEVRKRLLELVDRRHSSAEEPLDDLPVDLLLERAYELIVHGRKGQWGLPEAPEHELSAALEDRRRELRNLARRDRVRDPDEIGDTAVEELLPRLRRHMVRNYLGAGKYPTGSELERYSRKAAKPIYEDACGRARETDSGLHPVAFRPDAVPDDDLGSLQERGPLADHIRQCFGRRRAIYRSNLAMRAVLDWDRGHSAEAAEFVQSHPWNDPVTSLLTHFRMTTQVSGEPLTMAETLLEEAFREWLSQRDRLYGEERDVDGAPHA